MGTAAARQLVQQAVGVIDNLFSLACVVMCWCTQLVCVVNVAGVAAPFRIGRRSVSKHWASAASQVLNYNEQRVTCLSFLLLSDSLTVTRTSAV